MLPVFLGYAAIKTSNDITITGKITDGAGKPLSATIHAGKVYAVTDPSGSYQITVKESVNALNYAAVGYEDQKIKINGRRVINVVLLATSKKLKEVIVPGLGYENKSEQDKTASMLSGKVSGVIYSTPSPYVHVGEQEYNREGYSSITENGFRKVSDEPLSTFSIDVDAASYSNVRRFLNSGQLPPDGAVRTEEMINYFKYSYPQPAGNDPFSITTEMSTSPWNAQNRLLLIGLQGKNIPVENLPPSNLVFLVDVSGSMNMPDKLPLVQASLKMLTDQLREKDKISIVVYAGNAGLVLPAVSGNEKMKIKTAIDALEAGGSTAGGAGIQLAYKVARENFMKEGNNRVILCTDGDFNVGVSSDAALVRMIEKERTAGIFLTVLGYGTGNYQDDKMQQLADKGNGNHAYIDGLSEAKKVLVNEFGGTLFTIAKDVKLQVEFNPETVAGYRLIGYENRMLNKEDFNDDKKDAGELGSGHTVTALYEIIPAGTSSPFLKDVDPLKYQKNTGKNKSSMSDEIATIKFRYKTPDGEVSKLMVHPVKDNQILFENTSDNFRFAASVAEFSMLLRDSEFKENASYSSVIRIAGKALGEDPEGYRKEFVRLVRKASQLKKDVALNGDYDAEVRIDYK